MLQTHDEEHAGPGLRLGTGRDGAGMRCHSAIQSIGLGNNLEAYTLNHGEVECLVIR